MKANGSRREEKGGKNITEKIRCVPRSERKTVGRASREVGGGGGGRSMRGAGAGRATRARTCPRRRRAGRRPHSQRHRRSSLVSASPSAPLRAAAAPLAPTPARAARPNTRVSASTLHVQSAKVSASDRHRESAPAAFTRDRPDLHVVQG